MMTRLQVKFQSSSLFDLVFISFRKIEKFLAFNLKSRDLEEHSFFARCRIIMTHTTPESFNSYPFCIKSYESNKIFVYFTFDPKLRDLRCSNETLLLVVVVVVWRGISSKTDGRAKAEGLFFYHPGHQTSWVKC